MEDPATSEGRRAQLKFMSTTAFIGALAEELADDEAVETSAPREEEDPSELALDLGVVASIVAIVRFTAIDGPLVPKIWRALRRSSPRELVIKSPTRTIRIDYNDELTEEEVRTVLRQAVELT